MNARLSNVIHTPYLGITIHLLCTTNLNLPFSKPSTIQREKSINT